MKISSCLPNLKRAFHSFYFMFVSLDLDHVLSFQWRMTSKWHFLLPSSVGSMHKVLTPKFSHWILSHFVHDHQMKKRFHRYEIIVEFHLQRSSMSKLNDRSRGRGDPKPRQRPRVRSCRLFWNLQALWNPSGFIWVLVLHFFSIVCLFFRKIVPSFLLNIVNNCW